MTIMASRSYFSLCSMQMWLINALYVFLGSLNCIISEPVNNQQSTVQTTNRITVWERHLTITYYLIWRERASV